MSRVVLVDGPVSREERDFRLDEFRFEGRLPGAERTLLRRVIMLRRMLRAKGAQARALRGARGASR